MTCNGCFSNTFCNHSKVIYTGHMLAPKPNLNSSLPKQQQQQQRHYYHRHKQHRQQQRQQQQQQHQKKQQPKKRHKHPSTHYTIHNIKKVTTPRDATLMTFAYDHVSSNIYWCHVGMLELSDVRGGNRVLLMWRRFNASVLRVDPMNGWVVGWWLDGGWLVVGW